MWEGAAVALILALILFVARSSRLRYAAACGALFAMPVCFVVTYWLALPTPATPRPLPVTIPIFDFPVSASEGSPLPGGPPLPWLVMLWMTGAALLYAWRIAGWITAQRLRRTGVCAPPALWRDRLAELAGQLGIQRAVALLESSLAETPLTIGLLRPAILMPVGILTGLPAEQVEAILLHELAHIRRFDYLVNLAQSLVEGLLFYHPAVWWVSHVVRREREFCCDDAVVAHTNDAPTFARALSTLEHHRVHRAALAATGGSLILRVRRLLGQPAPRFAAGPVLGILLLGLAGGLAAWEPEPAPPPEPPPAPKPQQPAAAPAPANHPAALPAAVDEEPTPGPAPEPHAAQDSPPATPAPRPTIARPMTDEERKQQEERLLREKKSRYKAWLEEPVHWKTTPETVAQTPAQRPTPQGAIIALRTTDEERQVFIENFWIRRDPTPDTQQNEFREEHYRRIAWANDRFAAGVPGWRSDRGMIYIQFGPPDERQEHPAARPSYEIWRYRVIEGVGRDVMMYFVQDATGEYRMTWDPAALDGVVNEPRPAGNVPVQNIFDRLQEYRNLRPRPEK